MAQPRLRDELGAIIEPVLPMKSRAAWGTPLARRPRETRRSTIELAGSDLLPPSRCRPVFFFSDAR
jgi:hypothetical protein